MNSLLLMLLALERNLDRETHKLVLHLHRKIELGEPASHLWFVQTVPEVYTEVCRKYRGKKREWEPHMYGDEWVSERKGFRSTD